MIYSYSRLDTFKRCSYQFKLRYLDYLKTIPNYDADNPLILGSTLHLRYRKKLW